MKLLPNLKGIGKLHLGTPHHDPARDWLVLLSLALLWLVASMLWNGWFLISVLQEETTAPVTAVATSTPDTFERAWTLYQARDAEALHYANDYRFNDPSK